MRKVTEDFIGTCQACFGEFKVNEGSKLIVFHGYKRPGDGYTIGQCAGTDHAPFEYDTALTVEIIKQHRDRAAKARRALNNMNAGKIIKLIRYWQEYNKETRRYDDKQEWVSPDHPEWDRTLRHEIAKEESNERYHSRVADYLQGMVDRWTRGKIVGIDVPATGLSRPLRKAYDPAEADAAAARAAEKATRDAKPGKLKVMFYRPSGWPEDGLSYDDRRTFFDKRDAAKTEWKDRLKAAMKEKFPGKVIVREDYDSSLPRSIRSDNKAHFDVVSVNLDWTHRDGIEAHYPDAKRIMTEKKRIEYVVLDVEEVVE
jgi:hypothetical protein